MQCLPASPRQAAHTPAWVRLLADDASWTVRGTLIGSAPSSLLATLLDLELARPGGAEQEMPCVRLDCSAAVAQEVVAVLRQGATYEPPSDTRLLKALQHQVDFLGIAAPTVPPAPPSTEVVLLPSYWYMGLNSDAATQNVELQQAGLLAYSSAAKGWANITGGADPRPSELRGDAHPQSGGGCWLSSVLRAEHTSAGEDLCISIPNKVHSSSSYGDAAVCLRSSLTSRRVAMPPVHKRLRCSDAAMAAAQGRIYLLGGSCHMEVSACTPFEVYEPALDTWFTSTSPLPGNGTSLSGHALVSNQQEGLLLALGGCLTSGDKRHRQQRANTSLLMLDVRSGRWEADPSGCGWPADTGAAAPASVSAVAADPYTVLVLSAQRSGAAHGGPCVRTRLLDLRTWRWREGAPLRGGGSSASSSPTAARAALAGTAGLLPGEGGFGQALQGHAAGAEEPECLLSHMGLVAHDGRVLAVGGRQVAEGGTECASRAVRAYDPAADAWAPLPDLPFPVCHASPVTMRLRPTVL